MTRWAVGWDVGPNSLDLVVLVHNCDFSIFIGPRNFSNSPCALTKFKRIHTLVHQGKDYLDEVWDFADWAAGPFVQAFASNAPEPPVRPFNQLTLADLYDRKHFDCQLNVVDETPVAGLDTPRDNYDGQSDDANLLAKWYTGRFPVLDAKDVVVVANPDFSGGRGEACEEELMMDYTMFDCPRRVTADGRDLFFKSVPYTEETVLLSSAAKYAKIIESGVLRTSRLYGLVVAPPRVLGLLYDWIPFERSLFYAVIGDDDSDKNKATLAEREKWAHQIKDMDARLHEIQVVWGDVKPDNVLIDKNGDVVIIDFEAGFTGGWIDAEKQDTVEGDLQGLERLMDFMFNEESLLRKEWVYEDHMQQDREQGPMAW
ncbi:hypothetical protein B0H66DRAFT_602724 [Apodospora peruviana]|uniref:Protein kinase domain-containing protein n=1 Tax=Apodospora peruviana TaxID=516989 RepID=A0AAE0M3L2_9PEZI|nr:hypothetical protein B0H66DRAFT_602724 [Apodospora peruviana]